MKKILITIIIFWVAATVTSYADGDNSKSGFNFGNAGGGNSGAYSRSASDDSWGGDPSPYGDAIGQQFDPIGDGLSILIVCSVAFGLVKYFIRNRRSIAQEQTSLRGR